MIPALDRLPQRILDKIELEPTSGCWLWTAYTNPQGYGMVAAEDGRARLAHRVVYQLLVGEIEKRTLDHRCRVRRCVNPTHQVPATDFENIHAPGSQARAHLQSLQTHCSKHGLPLDQKKYGTQCRECAQCRQNRNAASRRWALAHVDRERERWRRSNRKRALRSGGCA